MQDLETHLQRYAERLAESVPSVAANDLLHRDGQATSSAGVQLRLPASAVVARTRSFVSPKALLTIAVSAAILIALVIAASVRTSALIHTTRTPPLSVTIHPSSMGYSR